MNYRNVEFIVTLRCKECGDLLSMGMPLTFDDAIAALEAFRSKHDHTGLKQNPNPWET